jgi:crotonobetainyl-CoA:carnitine CoA-transferase CaiB-like acyl-CoA transferase
MAAVFEGLRVLDFCWVVVGPLTTKHLADHGATVIRVESVSRLDYLRSTAPFKDGRYGLNRSQFWATFNTSKKSLGLNLSSEEGRELILRLVEEWQPDIVTESFAPGQMARWGFDYESLRGIKPDIIYFSTTQLGQTGAYAQYAGFGNLGAAIAGLNQVTGWPDRSPIGPWGAMPDMVNPPLAMTAIIAALEYRRRTGKGQRLDLSQVEGSLQYIAPSLLEFTANGAVAERIGNRDPEMAPHGVFPVAGDDRWIAIAVRDDEDWSALGGVAAGESWAIDRGFAHFAGRKEHEDELETAIATWTATKDGEQLMLQLQAAGVPAAVVKSCLELMNDPQLTEANFFHETEHLECGKMPVDGPSFRLSVTPWNATGAPVLGEHNEEILTDILKISDPDLSELVAEGVIESP